MTDFMLYSFSGSSGKIARKKDAWSYLQAGSEVFMQDFAFCFGVPGDQYFAQALNGCCSVVW